MTTKNRTAEIEQRLREYLGELGCTIITPTPAEWKDMPVGRFRFGWIAPGRVNDGASVTFICPELIDTTSRWLDDELFGIYLSTIEACMAGRMKHADLPLEDAMRLVENELYEEAPAGLHLLSEVEAEALDDNLV